MYQYTTLSRAPDKILKQKYQRVGQEVSDRFQDKSRFEAWKQPLHELKQGLVELSPEAREQAVQDVTRLLEDVRKQVRQETEAKRAVYGGASSYLP